MEGIQQAIRLECPASLKYIVFAFMYIAVRKSKLIETVTYRWDEALIRDLFLVNTVV
jgi:hypothetical protein